MREFITVLLVILLIPATALAAEQDGWSTGLFIGEIAAGVGVGAVTGLGLAYISLVIRSHESFHYAFEDAIAIALIGDGLGAAAGVILIGEGFGAKSENKAATSLGTIGAGLGSAGLLTGTVFLLDKNDNDDAATIVAYSSLIVTPVTTAIMYNVFKKPKVEDKATIDTGLKFRPTTGYLADSGGKFVPTYGVEVAF